MRLPAKKSTGKLVRRFESFRLRSYFTFLHFYCIFSLAVPSPQVRRTVKLDIIEALVLESQGLGYQVSAQLAEIADQDRAIYRLRHDHVFNGHSITSGDEYKKLETALGTTLESMRTALTDLQVKHREVIEKLEALAKS